MKQKVRIIVSLLVLVFILLIAFFAITTFRKAPAPPQPPEEVVFEEEIERLTSDLRLWKDQSFASCEMFANKDTAPYLAAQERDIELWMSEGEDPAEEFHDPETAFMQPYFDALDIARGQCENMRTQVGREVCQGLQNNCDTTFSTPEYETMCQIMRDLDTSRCPTESDFGEIDCALIVAFYEFERGNQNACTTYVPGAARYFCEGVTTKNCDSLPEDFFNDYANFNLGRCDDVKDEFTKQACLSDEDPEIVIHRLGMDLVPT